jgi:hypothetical protein
MALQTTANIVIAPSQLFISALCQVKEEAKKNVEISPRFYVSNTQKSPAHALFVNIPSTGPRNTVICRKHTCKTLS